MNKTPEGLKEKTKEIFDMERKLDKLYEQRREIINYLGLNKKPQQQPPLSGFLIPTSTTEKGMTIKNGDTPAMPITYEQAIEARMRGLTKREMIAMAAMHGLLANSSCRYSDYKYVAQNSVTAADALLAALDRTNDN